MKFPVIPTVFAVVALTALAFISSGCFNKTTDAKPLRFYVQVNDTGSMGTKSRPMTMPDGMVLFVKPDPVLMERHINNVDLVRVANGRLALLFYTNDEGSGALYRTSASERGRFMVFEYNGIPLGERQLDAVISDGRYFTFVDVPEEEMEELVLDIRANLTKLHEFRSSKLR